LFLTRGALDYFWITEFALAGLRLAVIIEICRRVLRAYGAVWALAWRLLTIVGFGLLVWAASTRAYAHFRTRYFLTTGLQRVELTQAILLLVVLSIGLYYRVQFEHVHRRVLIGLCIFSAIHVFDYALAGITVNWTNSVYDLLGRYTFLTMLLIWTWAIWRRGAEPDPPLRLPRTIYDEHSETVHRGLERINHRLAEWFRN
jgi:hypothetical protein